MKNFDYLYDNLDQNLNDEDALKSEVKEYMKVSKNNSKQYKENIIKKSKELNPNANSALKSAYEALFEDGGQQAVAPPKEKRKEHDLWNCERKPANQSEQHLRNIPLGDKEA